MPIKENTTQPLQASGDDSQYLVHTQNEIAFIMREAIEKKAMFTAYFNRGSEFILTALLTVLPGRGSFIFDCGSKDNANNKLLESDRVIFVTTLNGIKIQFVATDIREVQYKGSDALIAKLPRQLLRLQRREFFRLEIPGFAKINCEIPDALNNTTTTLHIHDISLGGLSLNATKRFENSAVLEKFRHCQITLKEFGIITVDIEVRYTIVLTQSRGEPVTRIGCRFINITPHDQVLIQRYMAAVETEERGLIPEKP